VSYWVTPAQVRTFANLDSSTGRYSDAALGSNILAAQQLIEQRTGRLFTAGSATRKFTTEGRAQLAIPDLRSVQTVTLNGTNLTADETYWLIQDAAFPTIYTSIQFRAFGRNRAKWYLSVPDWWDRGLDMETAYETTSLPNDLVITSTEWGWADIPYDVMHATKAVAAWMTKRADALLGNAVQQPDGTVFAYDRYPPELDAILATYRVGEQMVSVF
jgi:hypothetical protein